MKLSKKSITILLVIIVLIAAVIAAICATKIARGSDSYFTVSDKGLVSLKYEYFDIESLFDEKRFTDEEKSKILSAAEEVGVSAEQYVTVSYMDTGEYYHIYENQNEFYSVLDKLTGEYSVNGIDLLCEVYEKENSLINFIIKCKLSESYKPMPEISELNIPSKIGKTDVVGINNYGFYGLNNVANITVPKSVTKVGDAAFAESNVSLITFSAEYVDIDVSAVMNCNNLEQVLVNGEDVLNRIWTEYYE